MGMYDNQPSPFIQYGGQSSGQPMGQQPFGYTPTGMQNFANSANVFLSNYGMQEPTPDQINPYLFFGNSGYLGSHPRVARGIDAALSGAAFTHPSDTIGGGINSVAQGIMQSRQAHVQNIIGQYQRPIQMAEQLQSFQQGAANVAKTQAEAGYYNDRTAATRPTTDSWTGITHVFNPKTKQWEVQGPSEGAITHGQAYEYGANQRKAASDYAADMRNKAKAAGITKTERTAKLLEADDVENGGAPWSPGKQARVIQQIDANNAGAALGARKGVGQAMGDVDQTKMLDYETDKAATLHGLLKSGDIMDQFAAEEKGFKSVEAYNQDLQDRLKSRHPEIFNKPQAAAKPSKPSAVAPKSGAKRPPITSFEGK